MQAWVSREPLFLNTQDVAQALENTYDQDWPLDTSLWSLLILNVYKYSHSCQDHFTPFPEYHGELFFIDKEKNHPSF